MRKRSLVLTGLAAVGMIFATSGSSQAATGRCYKYEACYYYNSNHAGAVGVVGSGAMPDLDVLVFAPGTGNGSGQRIKNNAASAENDASSYYFLSFYNSLWQGPYDIIPANSWRNLNVTYNENASSCFNTTTARPSYDYCHAQIVD